MKPTSAPAVRLLDGPIHTPTSTMAEIVNAEKISPDGKRKAPMSDALIWARVLTSTASCTRCSSTSPASYARTVGVPDTTSAMAPSMSPLAWRAPS